jgi:RTX calcium-binding nonapeptide repeat (4 copies)
MTTRISLFTLIALVSLTASASAANVRIDAGRHRLVYTPKEGEVNRPMVDVSMFGGQTAVVVERGNKKLFAGPGCVQDTPKRATCIDPATIGSVSIDLADLGDRARVVGNPLLQKVLVDGGAGGDRVTTIDVGGESFLTGGSGADTLTNSGAGASTMGGGTGPDTLTGGDKVDVLYGSDGADVLDGRNGDDVLYGLIDADSLAGGFGDDTLFGGDGADTLAGGPGADTLLGESGADQLDALDGFEDPVIDCGPGADNASIDIFLEFQNVSSC